MEMAMDQRIQDMCLLASPRLLRGLVMVTFLALMLVFPASAQTNSDPFTKSTGDASAQVQAKRALAGPKLATRKTASNAVTLGVKSTATSVGSKAAGTQPESDPGTKKAGFAVLVNIDKTKQKMTVF